MKLQNIKGKKRGLQSDLLLVLLSVKKMITFEIKY